MRFSLATLVLLVLWVGAVMAVWVRREPWTIAEKHELANGDARFQNLSLYSPDKTRAVYENEMDDTVWLVYEQRPGFDLLCQIAIRASGPMSQPVFFDDNNIQAIRLGDPEHGLGPHTLVTYHRRFPEWWWGHFYRPEVWLALGLSVALVWRAVRKRGNPKVATEAKTEYTASQV